MLLQLGINSFYKTKYLVLLVLILAGIVIPACADSNNVPSLPLILEGSVSIGDEAASSGTEITAELDGEVVGITTTGPDGVYGDWPETKLVVTCEPEDYDDLKFYVDGVEAHISADDIGSLSSGDTFSLDIAVSASSAQEVSDSESSSSSSGGSGGSSGGLTAYSSTGSSADDNVNVFSEENTNKFESTADSTYYSSDGDPADGNQDNTQERTSVFVSFSGIVVTLFLGLIVLLAFLKFRHRN
ncbi:hypothetical protein [Methanolobus psychrotolerans]|uniref:hypothetical protein n=1 Tax=Methanolobus psychrotolerans TaxID=1874706 RepID=UPI000B917C49|nr:hypothetical protein [Methanolobus psychrotolerans]